MSRLIPLALVASLAGVTGLAGEARALVIVLDQTHTFRYVNATSSTTIGSVPDDWFEYDFDDSTWFTGNQPFSSTSTGATIFNAANQGGPFAPDPVQGVPATFTQWDVNFDPFLRAEFTLAAPEALTIWIAVDNGITEMYLNGVEATAGVNLEGAAFRWEHVFDIPATHTFAGRNVLAIHLEDHGVQTGFVSMVTENDDADNEDFTTNPPPEPPDTTPRVPEPTMLILFLGGLIGLGALARGRVARG
jgi:hypothetical protein